MRKLMYISGALFSSFTLLSVLFKLLHWKGAETFLIIGIVGLALLFIPSFAFYKYCKNKSK